MVHRISVYRNVWLGFSRSLHFDLWGVYAWPQEVSDQKGALSVEIGVKNESQAGPAPGWSANWSIPAVGRWSANAV